MTHDDCPFCNLPNDRVVKRSERLVAVRDHHPVSKGHTLLIPRRHLASAFELDGDEWTEMLSLMRDVKGDIDSEHQPSGYNIGFNIGEDAGQAQPHTYMHVIPRYAGDHPAPQGGLRHVIPWKR